MLGMSASIYIFNFQFVHVSAHLQTQLLLSYAFQTSTTLEDMDENTKAAVHMSYMNTCIQNHSDLIYMPCSTCKRAQLYIVTKSVCGPNLPKYDQKGLVTTATKICPTGMQLTMLFRLEEYLHKSMQNNLSIIVSLSSFLFTQWFIIKKNKKTTTNPQELFAIHT